MGDVLTPECWVRVKSVYFQALELPEPDREIYLESACGGDWVVKREVARLIEHDSATPSFLDRPLSAWSLFAKSLAQRPPVFRAGDLINHRFRVVRFIGAGGMGEVYEAADASLGGTHVALKTVRSFVAGNREIEAQFRREVRIARQITHPKVCRIYDLFDTRIDDPLCGGSRTLVFLTMELLEGESLAERLARTGRLSTQEALPLLRDIVSALSAAHEKGVIHRDLKSSNVMLVAGDNGYPKAVLTDFGLAVSQDAHARGGERSFAGTPDYMAPEQLERGETGFASDIFSLGVVLYEAITGSRPFEPASSIAEARRNRGKPAAPRAHAPPINKRWEGAILKCLAEDPAARFPSADALLDAVEGRAVARFTRRAALAAALAGAAGWLVLTGRHAGITSMAILPFENASGEADLGYFAEGLTQDLVPMVTRFRGLRVIAPTKAQLKNVSGLKAIGAALKVMTALSGQVRRDGSRIRVTAQLTNISDGMPVWTGAYVEEVNALARIRLNLSLEISGALEPRLGRSELASMAGPQSANAEAYNLYLAGKHYASYRTDDALRRAADCLEQSVAADPTFAPAYAALSDVYAIRAGQVGCPPSEYIPKAVEAAKRALELHPQSGEAHTALGFVLGRRWDWAGSERELRAALQLNPGLAMAHYRYAGLHSVLGRPQMALAEVLIARDLDPLSPTADAGYGSFLYRARRYDEAAAQLQNTLRTFPDSTAALSALGMLYDTTGKFAEAIAAHRKALETGPGYYFRYASRLGHALARAGYAAEAKAIGLDLEAKLGKEHYSPMAIGTVYLGLGDVEKTFYWYSVAVRQRDPSMEVLNVDPMNDRIREEGRFSELLQQVGLT